MTFTLLYGAGFEEGSAWNNNIDGWVYYENYGDSEMAVAAGGVGGSYHLYMKGPGNGGATVNYTHTLPTSLNEVYAGVYQSSSDSRSVPDFRFYVGSDYYSIKATVGATVSWDIMRNGVSQGVTGSALTLGYHSVQVHYKVDDSVGIFETKIDGVPYNSVSGDTKISTGSMITAIQLGSIVGEFQYTYWDNYYYGTGDWGGAIQFSKIVPTSDSSKGWSSTGASNYSVVDEVPTSDSDYVYTSVDATKDLYGLGDFDATDKTIVGLVLTTRAKKTTAGSNKLITIIKSGSTEYPNPVKSLDTSYKYFKDVYALNPDDNAAWEDADIDALISGIENEIT